MMSVGAGKRKSTAVVQGGGMDEEKIRELLEKQMQGQQHDIHAMMALVQSLSQGGGGSALLEQQMSVLKLQQEQVLQERERLAAEIAKMQTLQGADTKSGSISTSTSTSTNKKDDVLDAAAAAAEKQEDAAIELLSLQHDLSTVASLPSHELAAKAQALGVACARGDDDETLRTRLLEHIAQKTQQLTASVDAEKARQDEAMQERMQRLKAEREAARTKLASAIAAAESGDVASAVAAAAAAADATGDAHVAPAILAADSGETDEEKRQKLIQQLQVHPPPLFATLRVTRPRCRRPWRRWTAALVLRRRGRRLRYSRFDCTPCTTVVVCLVALCLALTRRTQALEKRKAERARKQAATAAAAAAAAAAATAAADALPAISQSMEPSVYSPAAAVAAAASPPVLTEDQERAKVLEE